MSFLKKLENNKFQNEVFHIHTYRCEHASYDSDEDYIKKAISIGSKKITFTDHCPFPNNPFYSRMKYEDLTRYIYDLNVLKSKYESIINVCIGLEIEYLPSYNSYYDELKEKLDIMLIGQHFFEIRPGEYSFSYNLSKEDKLIGIINGMILGVLSNKFNIVAHPDRFITNDYINNKNKYDILYKQLFYEINNHNMLMEYNLYSAELTYASQIFWNDIPNYIKLIIGCDAHSVFDIDTFSNIIKREG